MFSSSRRRVLSQMLGGLAVSTVPIAAWWYTARRARAKLAEDVRTQIRIPGSHDVLDQILEDRCQAGDVILFDRRCESCAHSPWAALACVVAKGALCDDSASSDRTVSEGRFDHMGVVVPGYIRKRADEWDPANLLLLEATASGIVARPLKARLEHSQAKSIVLVPLQVPGERRNAISGGGDDENSNNNGSSRSSSTAAVTPSAQAQSAARTRLYMEKQLVKFRDTWVTLGQAQNYHWMHNTLVLGGATLAAVGLESYATGPVSPAAWLVLMGLQSAAAATNLDEKQRLRVQPEDFVRHPSMTQERAIRLRPGWRLLAPINVRSR
jgi:hypothetical protein